MNNPKIKGYRSPEEEFCWLKERFLAYQREFPQVRFVLPGGGEAGSLAHVIRVKCKELVRLMYRVEYQYQEGIACGRKVPERALDLANLLSNYFFYLALKLNRTEGAEEQTFISRNYKSL